MIFDPDELAQLELEEPVAVQETNKRPVTLTELMAEGNCPPCSMIADLIPRGDLAILAAKSGVGKSFFALQLGLAVASGKSFLGRGVAAEPVCSLFLEDTRDVVLQRAIMLQEEGGNLDEAAKNRFFLRCMDPRVAPELWQDGRSTSELDKLEQFVKQEQVRLLIIDTAKLVFRDKITDTEAVRYFIQSLRRVAVQNDVAILLITHVNRAGDTSGTTEWENHARTVLHLSAHGDHYRLQFVKSNYSAASTNLALIKTPCGGWRLRPNIALGDMRSKPTRVDRQAILEKLFLRVLNNSATPLSAKKNAPHNYAPKVIAASADGRKAKAKVADLEQVMRKLLSEGRLEEVPGDNKHKSMELRSRMPNSPELQQASDELRNETSD